jgi:hypothetical protein
MKTYTATLKFVRVWSEEIIANSLEEAEKIAQEMADSEDNMLDINEDECVVLVGVEELSA